MSEKVKINEKTISRRGNRSSNLGVNPDFS